MNIKHLGAVGFASLLILLSLPGCRRKTYNEGEITAGKRTTFWSLLNVHESPITFLEIHGKLFENVRGVSPYFLAIPNSRLIFFVTSSHGEKTRFHIANLDTWEITVIEGGASLFGSYIGTPLDPKGRYGGWIDRYESPRLYLRQRTVSGETHIVLNLSTRKIESEAWIKKEPDQK
jgi:hypothetical protein